MAKANLRPAGFDDLGLQRALSDRLLPFLVAAMAFLAALALAGSVAAAALARHWQEGAEAVLTVQVPDPSSPSARPGASRLAQVLTLLRADPAVATARPLSQADLDQLLRPWLGAAAGRLALPLPAVIAVHLATPDAPLAALSASLETAAPGTQVESHGVWVRRLAALARSLQACAAVALLVVAAVAVAVVAVATHAGIAARREAIEIVHGLGASDGYMAARFAGRATRLAAIGGAAGALAALPVLLTLAGLAAPFGDLNAPSQATGAFQPGGLPALLWLALPLLPAIAAAIGYLTAQVTVRSWLRRLP
ncbi:MAG TPA: FtsX-like permease family protein [Acetobacteraceae bacterium]|nr:FtsX-like permease family protein [Acetobacteraceae bacterium]